MAWLQRLAKDAASVTTSVRCGGPRRVRGGSFDFELLPHVGIIWVQDLWLWVHRHIVTLGGALAAIGPGQCWCKCDARAGDVRASLVRLFKINVHLATCHISVDE